MHNGEISHKIPAKAITIFINMAAMEYIKKAKIELELCDIYKQRGINLIKCLLQINASQ